MIKRNITVEKHPNIISVSVHDKFVTYGGVIVECIDINFGKLLTRVISKTPICYTNNDGNKIVSGDQRNFIYLLTTLEINLFSKGIFTDVSIFNEPTYDISNFNKHLNIQYKLETIKQKINLL